VVATSFLYCLLLYNSAVHESNLQSIASRRYLKAEDIHKRQAVETTPDRLIDSVNEFLETFQQFTNNNYKSLRAQKSPFLSLVPRNFSESSPESSHQKSIAHLPAGDLQNLNNNTLYEEAISAVFDRKLSPAFQLERLGFKVRYIAKKLLEFNQTNSDNLTDVGHILRSSQFVALLRPEEFWNDPGTPSSHSGSDLKTAEGELDVSEEAQVDQGEVSELASDLSEPEERELLKNDHRKLEAFRAHLSSLVRPEVSSTDKEFVVFLSALSPKQFQHGLQLIKSFKSFIVDERIDASNDDRRLVPTLVLYDLGLKPEQFYQVSDQSLTN